MNNNIVSNEKVSTNIHQTLFNLPTREKVSEHVAISEFGELDILVIKHPKFKAAIAKQGSHLISWQPNETEPVFWVSERSPFKLGKAIRGGIPVCWPWFGPLGSPSHGFARNTIWNLENIDDTNEYVELTLTLCETAETLKIWPHNFLLSMTFRLSDECNISMTSKGEFSFTTALHSYFNLSDIHNVRVKNVGGNYIDALREKQSFDDNENSETHFKTHIDRIFTNPSDTISLHDCGFKRKITLSNNHVTYQNACDKLFTKQPCNIVIWNPGAELSLTMDDMGDDGYLTMGCVESAVIKNHITLKHPNQHELFMKISCESNNSHK
ncbi:D-hexose-6-phosphate mutarotase [Thorsellia anophelis]|uniref:Putative glucose-6-phosphate 1-epimerase n=1 Tax=Thorsellia anophelis DSM 18579 TaxID=1123402 RepID=A0A1I0BSQ4_9GAMM|nr:D-hexose-6-phosphate mutarotase [Thorsellia anophelis]SET09673.1 glucose-6-phosphate 1-epimerase [Thorsellia anophelis DSM 18579]